MSNDSPSGTATTTQTTEPPSYVRPFLQESANASKNLYSQGPQQYYPGETVTPFSSQTQQALNLTQQRALNGSGVNDAAQGFAQRTLSSSPTSMFGDAQNPYAAAANPFGSASNPYAAAANPFGSASNPYLDSAFDQAAQRSRTQLSSEFARSGRNLDASAPARADMLSQIATGIYGPAYENERNRQLQYQQQLTGIGAQGYDSERNRQLQYQQQLTGIGAQGFEAERGRMATDIGQQRGIQASIAGLSPTLASQDYADLAALQGVGGQYDDLASRKLADQVSRFDYEQSAPGVSLDQYIARLNNQPGGSSSSTQPYYSNKGASALGGAAAGYGLGSQFGYGGYGALAGGLLGYFG